MIHRRLIPLGVMIGALGWLVGSGATLTPGRASKDKADSAEPLLAYDEQTLKKAGIATDGPGLLEYFRRRTPSAEELATLRQKSAQLGSSVFAVRVKATDELIRAGRAALPFLREVARKGDAETGRRAQYAIGIIESNTQLGLMATASRVLVERKPAGTVEVLLAYLPFADERWVEEEIRNSLKRVAYVDGKAVAPLEEALADNEPRRRAAAAWIVGSSSDARQRQLVVARLSDKSAEVRLLAATALLAGHEPTAVPTLIGLLAADSTDIAWSAEETLVRLAGPNAPTVWLGAVTDNNGSKVRDAWESWWYKHAANFDWKSVRMDTQVLGLTLVVENQRPDGASRIYETNSANEVRWEIKITNPIDAQWLPGGRLLVGDSRDALIYEMDLRGNVGWKHKGLSPTSIQRLPNGNTVVSTYQSIVEINRDGRTVFSYATQGHTYHARKLPDGHYVWIDASGEIGEVDEAGTLVAKTKVSGGLAWGSIERLNNGRYLIALGGVGKVQEVDMKGKVYWEKAVNNPNRAVRLANGHTLVASHADQSIYEFDALGNQRWKHPCTGRPFAAIRR